MLPKNIDEYCFKDFYTRLVLPYSQAKQYFEKQIVRIDPHHEVMEFYDFYSELKDEKQRGTVQDNLACFYDEVRGEYKNTVDEFRKRSSKSMIYKYNSYDEYKESFLLDVKSDKVEISEEELDKSLENMVKELFWSADISTRQSVLQTKMTNLNLMLKVTQDAERHMTAITLTEFDGFKELHIAEHEQHIEEHKQEKTKLETYFSENENMRKKYFLYYSLSSACMAILITTIGILIASAIGVNNIQTFFYSYLMVWIIAIIAGIAAVAILPYKHLSKKVESTVAENNKDINK